MGELEDKSLAKRTAIAPGGEISRTGSTYFDPDSKVDVSAPQGKFFVEYSNGRVELKDVPADGKVPDVQTFLNPGQTAAAPLGSSTPGDRGGGDALTEPFKLGELEQKALDERLGLGVSGDPSRVGTSFFDPRRGVDVNAAPGTFFVEFGGGGVEVRDLAEGDKVPTFEELFPGATAATPVGESTPGEGSTGVEGLNIPSIDGKEVSRTGATFFDEEREIDVQADEGHVFIEYADGSVEQRPISDITTPGEAKSKLEFGASFDELGLNPDGSQKGTEVDNSGLEYIGKSYTASNGQLRQAPEGQAFYQDPETRTILLRPDTGQENSLQSTSPSVLASRNDIPGMFEAVYGRPPSEQELEYWQGRRDKSGSALIGAMQFAKNEGKTIGGTPAGDGGNDPVGSIDSFLNSGQESDFSAIGAATTAVDLSKSSKLVDDLTKMLNERPSVPSLRDEFQNELLRSGYNEDAAELAEAERAIKQLDADFMSTIEGEEARRVSIGQIRRRQSAQEIAYNRIRRDMVVDRDFLANKVANKQAIVNTMVNLLGQDIANAQTAYQNAFQNAMSVTNLVRQVEQDQLTQIQRQQDNARANVQIMSSLLSSGNVKYNQLDAATKSQLKSMELQAGLPVGFTQFVGENIADPEVQFLPAYTDINGVRIQPIATIDPSTGAYTIKNVNQGKVDLPAGSGSGGGKPTEGSIARVATSDMAQQLNGVRGSDGFVSPESFRVARQAWVTNGYKADDFNGNFRHYANPSHIQDYGLPEPE